MIINTGTARGSANTAASITKYSNPLISGNNLYPFDAYSSSV